MDSKVCLITGGTSGIGRAAATQLAQQGATVLLTGRHRARGEAVVAGVRAAGGQADFLEADFASLASVRALAAEVRQRHDRLHVLVNNAGFVSGPGRRLTADGFEETFAVNHLATFLLTGLLRDLLVAGAPARVVTVASEAHRIVNTLDFENLQCERRYKPFLAYGQSKLENILFTYELDQQLRGSGVTANCLHPGVVRTGIWQNASGVLGFIARLAQPLMLSAEKSGRAVTRLAADPALADESGRYFNRERAADSSAGSHDPQAMTRLWEISREMTNDE